MSLESGVLGVFEVFFGVFDPLDLKNGSAVQSPASQAVTMVPRLCRNALFIAREPVLFLKIHFLEKNISKMLDFFLSKFPSSSWHLDFLKK